MKRIVICADGTWDTPNNPNATNVAKVAWAVAPRTPDGTLQVTFYDQGVGTGNILDKITGGVIGDGLDMNIEDAYRFLVNNFEDGDELFFFGFSRGAYTVRSVGGLIRKCGILRKEFANHFSHAYDLYRVRAGGADSPEAIDFRAKYSRETDIKFMGVWDTVGALGIPIGLFRVNRDRYAFHDVELSSRVKHGYHAVGIDEKRVPFEATLWADKQKPGQLIEQVWFAGVHRDIGGGHAAHGLSDLALVWLKEKAEALGLAFDNEYFQKLISPDPLGKVHEFCPWYYKLIGMLAGLDYGKKNPGYSRFEGKLYRDMGRRTNESLHPSVMIKHTNPSPPYKPRNLLKYLETK